MELTNNDQLIYDWLITQRLPFRVAPVGLIGKMELFYDRTLDINHKSLGKSLKRINEKQKYITIERVQDTLGRVYVIKENPTLEPLKRKLKTKQKVLGVKYINSVIDDVFKKELV